jgi:K+-sensing histidine kinase KdpD
MRVLLPYAVSAVLVLVVGLAARALMAAVPLPQVSVIFLAAVVTSAALWGFWPSAFTAFLSVAAAAFFFYAPIFDFRVVDATNIVDLAVFAGVAALTSHLAASVRAQALAARQRQASLAALLAFSERLAACADDEELRAAIAERLSQQGRPPLDEETRKTMLGHAALALDRARLRAEIAEARLRRQGEALREALLNSVSHDLQTPLAAILGSASALESLGEQGDPRARRELAATIRDQAERLASDIENVLDLTRIRAGQVPARLELVELADIVNAALRRKQRALAAHLVEVVLPADLPMLRLDLFLMEHALANVLDNAAQHSPAGSRLRVAARAENGEVVLEVSDPGSGIRGEDLERVFEPFYRGERPDAAPVPGSGLGLAICRAFVEANGGTVAALSPGAGQGATVRIRLPVPVQALAAVEPVDD